MHKHIFGPVLSRRLGVSLGVDLVPFKICTLDCIYCECGKTTRLTATPGFMLSVQAVKRDLEECLSKYPQLDYVTFTGSGEPTLNLHLKELVLFVKDRFPQYRTALLTNGTLFVYPEIREVVQEFDLIVPSLDAGTKEVFEKINRPSPEVSFEGYLEGLIELRKTFTGLIWLEIFLVPNINDTPEELNQMKRWVDQIKPDKIQLNSLDRPGAEDWVIPMNPEHLRQIATIFYPFPTEVVANTTYTPTDIGLKQTSDRETLINTIKRRPCTRQDLIDGLSMNPYDVDALIQELLESKVIVTEEQPRGVFLKMRSQYR